MPTPPAHSRRADADRLRDIGSLTDAGLAHLDVEDLLGELLERVRDVLRADTAAVLLLDEPTGNLVATAARGIEEEVHQGVKVPLGKGFAGRIAATRQPVIIEELDEADVVNPLLRARGIRSLLGVPLMTGGQLLGVLHVGTLVPRTFTDADVDLLRMVADRVALATRAHQSDSDRRAAVALQRSLLPAQLPRVPGIETAVRYIAGDEGGIGGDWYDLFVLPSGWVCITIGDVVGRGVRAAVVMGRLRSAVRAYTLRDGSDPAAVLEQVDRKLQHFEQGEMATVLLALLEPSLERLHLSSAGHPPPVVATGTGSGTCLDVPADPPVGVAHPVTRRVTTVELPPGAVACFYTDGLVERRGVPLDSRLRGLCDTVTAGPADEVCVAVMQAMIGHEPPPDDVAVLLLRRLEPHPTAPLELKVPAVASSLREIRAAANRWLASVDASATDVVDVLLALGEATSNVVEHAYGPAGGDVAVRLELQPPDVVVTVSDRGRWRDPRGTDRGRGTRLMQAASDEVGVDRRPDGTDVVIRRRLHGERPG